MIRSRSNRGRSSGWDAEFEDPVTTPEGKPIPTLSDARAYILSLKKKDQDSEPWQTAIHALLMAAEGQGPLLLARAGMLKAMNHGKPRVFSDRKETHWGKRKLKRDE